MILQAENLTLARAGRTVLTDVSFTLAPGEVVGLIGPNGAGKTTLLRALAALDAPASGAVLYGGETAHHMGRARLGRSLAYLAQSGRIHWPMRVRDVVALGRLPHPRDAATDAAAVERALARADIAPLKDRVTGTLSGGERMRVLIARALAVEAPILLADEPVAALDPYHQLHAMEMLRAEAQDGAGVVVVLHDLTLAARFCDRVLALADGRVLAAGAPRDVLDPTLLRTAYGVDFETGTLKGEPFALPWTRLPAHQEPPP